METRFANLGIKALLSVAMELRTEAQKIIIEGAGGPSKHSDETIQKAHVIEELCTRLDALARPTGYGHNG